MEVIKRTKGPCVILAGAGTGKTHIIVEKTKYLINNKIYPPEKIVCITFSNEAANNLYTRIKNTINSEKEPIIKTFHAFSADLLKEYGEEIGVKKDFKILTPDDAKIVLNKYFRTQPLLCHKYISTIGTAKDIGIKIENLENYIQKNLSNLLINIEKIDKEINEIQLELHTKFLKK